MSIESIEARVAMADRLGKSLSFAEVTPTEMADRLGVTVPTVEAWISGRTVPRLSSLMVWASVAGVPFEWLTGTEDERP